MSIRFDVVALADPGWRSRAVDTLRDGGVVALPTDTFYGLAVCGRDAAALESLNRIKRKSAGSPILMLAADLDQARQILRPETPHLDRLADRFWPGPLTLLGPRQEGWPEAIAVGRQTVAVRVPAAEVPRTVARELGVPISGVSANRHGASPPVTVDAIDLDGIDLAVDGGACPGGQASTLLDLASDPPRILREGEIGRDAIESVVGRLVP
ncbi:MAG: L-threonylcarbamoyladenylate synthase [Acidobacteriota bacterium]|nr:L-threonylcarbamoyladenylate synthase [Acidobacteriota bacterium]MDH3784384.1 L-threonylcarbamoyladenylate synthase [Acidobacteriota bacterium]